MRMCCIHYIYIFVIYWFINSVTVLNAGDSPKTITGIIKQQLYDEYYRVIPENGMSVMLVKGISCIIADDSRYLQIATESAQNIYFYQNGTVQIGQTEFSFPYDCFAQVNGDVRYGLCINDQYYVNGKPINISTIKRNDSQIETLQIDLEHKDLWQLSAKRKNSHNNVLQGFKTIHAPICLIEEKNDLAHNIILLKGPRQVLQHLEIKQQKKENSLEISITPKPKTKILTNHPIICYIPAGGYSKKIHGKN